MALRSVLSGARVHFPVRFFEEEWTPGLFFFTVGLMRFCCSLLVPRSPPHRHQVDNIAFIVARMIAYIVVMNDNDDWMECALTIVMMHF